MHAAAAGGRPGGGSVTVHMKQLVNEIIFSNFPKREKYCPNKNGIISIVRKKLWGRMVPSPLPKTKSGP
jgi:hypothetical protein